MIICNCCNKSDWNQNHDHDCEIEQIKQFRSHIQQLHEELQRRGKILSNLQQGLMRIYDFVNAYKFETLQEYTLCKTITDEIMIIIINKEQK